jgi:hypothetical protein
VSYNVYRTIISETATIPVGVPFGFIGNVKSTSIIDTNIVPDFSQSLPIIENPFSGSGVQTVTLGAHGAYTSVPTATCSPPGGGGTTATLAVTLGVVSFTASFPSGQAFVGDTLKGPNGSLFTVTSVNGINQITGISILYAGAITAGSTPANPVILYKTSNNAPEVNANLTWGVIQLAIVQPGTGYGSAPTITFTPSGATATCTLGSNFGNPTVPGFIQQRLFLGGEVLSPSQFNMSQPGIPYNFNTSFPVQPDDAIQETLSNTVLNSIKSVIPVSSGLIIFADQGAWLLNGGSAGAPISATQIVANPQVYSGAGDLPPVVTPTDILYVQAKGSIVRDLAYNFYLANYVGNDVSVLSSHLFYGFSLIQWAWAEEPYKVAWAVRNDGRLLSLTFLKEQELIAWAHHDTLGAYSTIASINESTAIGNVDAVYVGVQRVINGQTVAYIERFVELNYPNDYQSSWQVDAGIGYTGAAATTFSGAQHLAGSAVTGVADGAVINFTMPVSGTFVFGPGGTPGLTGIASASIVTVGLAFLPQLQPLPLDLGEPTIQSKRKKIASVTVRIKQALGLQIGRLAATAVNMKDMVIGNVGTMTNTTVTGLVTGDARTVIDPLWDVYGQYLIQQPLPYPATILAVIPEVVGGDKDK